METTPILVRPAFSGVAGELCTALEAVVGDMLFPESWGIFCRGTGAWTLLPEPLASGMASGFVCRPHSSPLSVRRLQAERSSREGVPRRKHVCMHDWGERLCCYTDFSPTLWGEGGQPPTLVSGGIR